MRAEANFLTAGSSWAFDLPEPLDPAPELESVVALDGAGRYIVYRPAARADDPRSNALLAHAFDVRSKGTLVSVYGRRDEPSSRIAYWHLPGGSLITFVDDRSSCGIDPDAEIKRVIAGITVRTSKVGLPALELRRPLFPGNPRDPLERDGIMFFGRGAEAGVPYVHLFNEPAWVPQGTSRWEEGELAEVAVTNELNLTVRVQGPRGKAKETEDQAKRIASSMVPLD